MGVERFSLASISGCDAAIASFGRLEDVARLKTSPEDRASAETVPPARQAEHLAARALLRNLLHDVVDDEAARSSLRASQRGQPCLADHPDVGVSLSHSHGWVAAAVHRCGAVGVDVQVAVPVGDGLVRRCCTAGARSALAALPEAARVGAFARMWSVQEACVKASGGGLADAPWRIPVDLAQRCGRWGAIDWVALPSASTVGRAAAVLCRHPSCDRPGGDPQAP